MGGQSIQTIKSSKTLENVQVQVNLEILLEQDTHWQILIQLVLLMVAAVEAAIPHFTKNVPLLQIGKFW